MRLWVISCLLFLSFLQQATARGSGFVRKTSTHFIVNWKPLFVNGFNSYWLMTVAMDLTQRNKVTSVFQRAAALRLNVSRTWAFNDGQYKALQIFPGVYYEQVFQVCAWGLHYIKPSGPQPSFFKRFCFWVSGSTGIACFNMIFGVVLVQALDFVVFQARKYGIRLILSLANNYVNFGGKAQYVQWARNVGQNLNSDDDFFTNPTAKAYYKNRVKVTECINVCLLSHYMRTFILLCVHTYID